MGHRPLHRRGGDERADDHRRARDGLRQQHRFHPDDHRLRHRAASSSPSSWCRIISREKSIRPINSSPNAFGHRRGRHGGRFFSHQRNAGGRRARLCRLAFRFNSCSASAVLGRSICIAVRRAVAALHLRRRREGGHLDGRGAIRPVPARAASSRCFTSRRSWTAASPA